MPVNRKLIHQRIEDRFKSMMDQGFEAEVQALYARGDLNDELAGHSLGGLSTALAISGWPVQSG